MLTAKQQLFVQHFLVSLNATKAAVAAGYTAKYANRMATKLLAHPDVRAAIEAAKSARMDRVKISADYVLDRLVRQAEANLADLFDAENNLLPVEAWPEVWKTGLVLGVEVNALYEGGKTKNQIGFTKKVRLADRVRILELIGRHVAVNAFQENVHHTGMDTLGDRLQRAMERVENEPRLIEAKPVQAVEVTPPAAPAPISANTAAAAPREAAPPEAPASDAQHVGDDWRYRPILPRQDFVDVDYEYAKDGFLSDRGDD